MTEYVELPPDVSRIVEGLRDTGYEFNTAVADIIDNSIAANAKRVDVRFAVDYGGELHMCVGDNGGGMDRKDLENAMRYGSQRRGDPASLGKFGLGLKTASTAFARRLAVVSRSAGDQAPTRAVWDLDVMSQRGEWCLEIGEPSIDEISLLNEIAPGSSGTIVLWSKIDRLLPEYKNKTGNAVKNAVKRITDSLAEHIAMVYQRFLDPHDTRARTVEILLNHKAVPPWDPFCLDETHAPVLERDQPIVDEGGNAIGNLRIRAFVLPRKEEFSSDAARASARVSVEMQGIYVYRENRMIHGPDWLGLSKPDSHLSLLRVELSFTHQLDDIFHVDIKKSRILLNNELFNWLEKTLAGPRREADDRSRKGSAALAKGTASLLHKSSNTAIGMRADSLAKPKVTAANPETGRVELDAKSGHQSAVLKIAVPDSPQAVHVATATTLEDGVLWAPALISGNAGVSLNTAHPYYQKAYLPNRNNSPLVQALDFLLWALGQAELNNADTGSRDAFAEFRIDVSRNLKKLVADLPDPDPEEA